jgi:hypothetical protein
MASPNIVNKSHGLIVPTKETKILHTGYIIDIKSILVTLLKSIPEEMHPSICEYIDKNTVYVATHYCSPQNESYSKEQKNIYKQIQSKMRRWYTEQKKDGSDDNSVNDRKNVGFMKSYYMIDASTDKKVQMAIVAKINIQQHQHYIVLAKTTRFKNWAPANLKRMAPAGELGKEHMLTSVDGSDRINLKYDPYIYEV